LLEILHGDVEDNRQLFEQAATRRPKWPGEKRSKVERDPACPSLELGLGPIRKTELRAVEIARSLAPWFCTRKSHRCRLADALFLRLND
jgi:hypothetical protein